VRPIGAAEVGLLGALVGAWGAISVFVSPDFGYQPTSTSSWSWTTQNWLLHLVPGAVAVFAGVAIMSVTPRRRRGSGLGAPIGLAALLMAAAGAWFVIGPALWATFESGQPFAAGTSAGTSFVNQVGSSLGPGLLLALLAGMALKAVMARPAVAAVDPMAGDAVALPSEPLTECGERDQGRIDQPSGVAGGERVADEPTI
jgi:hypothetical protein